MRGKEAVKGMVKVMEKVPEGDESPRRGGKWKRPPVF